MDDEGNRAGDVTSAYDNIGRHLQMKGLARIDLGDLGGIDDMREALDLGLRLGLGFETAAAYNNLGEVVGAYESIREGLALTDASRRVRPAARNDTPRDVDEGRAVVVSL